MRNLKKQGTQKVYPIFVWRPNPKKYLRSTVDCPKKHPQNRQRASHKYPTVALQTATGKTVKQSHKQTVKSHRDIAEELDRNLPMHQNVSKRHLRKTLRSTLNYFRKHHKTRPRAHQIYTLALQTTTETP